MALPLFHAEWPRLRAGRLLPSAAVFWELAEPLGCSVSSSGTCRSPRDEPQSAVCAEQDGGPLVEGSCEQGGSFQQLGLDVQSAR